jgi:hypothetical protein
MAGRLGFPRYGARHGLAATHGEPEDRPGGAGCLLEDSGCHLSRADGRCGDGQGGGSDGAGVSNVPHLRALSDSLGGSRVEATEPEQACLVV